MMRLRDAIAAAVVVDLDHEISAAYTSAMSTAMKISQSIRLHKIILNGAGRGTDLVTHDQHSRSLVDLG